MPRKKPGLTLARHKEIGQILKDMNRQLVSLAVEFGNAYPMSGEKARPYQQLTKAGTALADARSSAENNCVKDFPDDWDVGFYFGSE